MLLGYTLTFNSCNDRGKLKEPEDNIDKNDTLRITQETDSKETITFHAFVESVGYDTSDFKNDFERITNNGIEYNSDLDVFRSFEVIFADNDHSKTGKDIKGLIQRVYYPSENTLMSFFEIRNQCDNYTHICSKFNHETSNFERLARDYPIDDFNVLSTICAFGSTYVDELIIDGKRIYDKQEMQKKLKKIVVANGYTLNEMKVYRFNDLSKQLCDWTIP